MISSGSCEVFSKAFLFVELEALEEVVVLDAVLDWSNLLIFFRLFLLDLFLELNALDGLGLVGRPTCFLVVILDLHQHAGAPSLHVKSRTAVFDLSDQLADLLAIAFFL